MKPCPTCNDTGPWATSAERTAHIRSHNEVECPDCGKRVSKVSLASHQRILHGDTEADTRADNGPATSADTADAADATTSDDPAPRADSSPDIDADTATAAADDLICPDCKKGPFADRRGLGVHRASHERVECPDCGQSVARPGLGRHRLIHDPTEATCPDCGGTYMASEPPKHRSRCTAAAAVASGELYVRCGVCDQAVHRDSLDAHSARMHRTAPRRAQPAPPSRPADPRALAGALSELLPGAAADLIARLAAFIEKDPPIRDRGLFVVAVPAGAGPWVCPPANVGMVVARERTAAVVVAVDDIYAHLGHHQAAGQSPFHAGASWPHPKATR